MTAKDLIDHVLQDMGVSLEAPYQGGSPLTRQSVLRFLDEGQRELVLRVTKIKEDYLLVERDVSPPEGGWPIDQAVPLAGKDYATNILINKVRMVRAQRDDGCWRTLRHVSLMDFEKARDWARNEEGGTPLGWRLVDRFIAARDADPDADPPVAAVPRSHMAPFLILSPPGSMGRTQQLRIYYVRKAPPLASEDDEPLFPESSTYLEDYAKWRIAQVDPSRSTETYEAKFEGSLRNLMETFTDRTPQSGGRPLQLSAEDAATSTTPVDWL